MARNQVIISVLADTKKFQDGLSGAGGALKGFAKLAGTVVAAGAAIATGIGVKAVKSASELEQNMGALTSVFKENSAQMTDWANKAASNLGLAKSEYAGLGTVLGSQLRNMGVSSDALAGQTNDLIKMGADLAAQFGGSTSDAVSALSSLLRGERDPIERYGVSINEAAIQAKLAEMGLSGLTGEAEKNAKLQATLALLTQQTADAQGAFARESNTLAGAQQRLAAGTENLYARLGTALLPAVTAVTGAIGGLVTQVSESAAFDSFLTRTEAVSTSLAGFVGQVASGQGSLAGFLDVVNTAAPGLVGLISQFSPLVILVTALAPLFPVLASALQIVASAITAGLIAILPDLNTLLTAAAQLVAALVPPIASLLTFVAQAAAGIISFVVANRDWITALGVVAGVIAGVVTALNLYRAVTLGITALTYGAQGAMLVAGTSAKVYAAGMAIATTATNIAAGAQRIFNFVLAANPIGLIVTAIAALVAGLVYFFTQTELGQQVWANFTQFLTEAWTNISNFAVTTWTAIADFFTQLWTNISTVFTDAWNGIVAFLTPIFEFIGSLIQTYIDVWVNIFIVFAAVFKTIWDGISSFFTGIWNAIVGFFTPIINNIVSTITTAVNVIQMTWNVVWGAISSFFQGVWNAIVGFISPIIARISSTITNAVRTVQGVWNGVWSAISSFFSGIWNGMVNAVSGAVGSVGNVIGGIYGKVMGALGNVGSWLLSAGRNLVQGFWNGISGMATWLRNQVTGFFDGVVGWAKGVLGIKSPSRVFMGIGNFLGQGLAKGITGTEALVAKATRGLARVTANAFDATLSADSASASLSGGYGSSTSTPVQIIVQGAYMTKADVGKAVQEGLDAYRRQGGRLA